MIRSYAAALLMANLGLAASAPVDSPLFAATNAGPYESLDGGVTWKQIFVTSTDPKLQGMPSMRALVADPQNPSTLYGTALYGSASAVLTSTDGGQTWTPISQPFVFGSGPGSLAIDPVKTSTLYALNNLNGLVISTDSGVTWTTPTIPEPTGAVSGGTPTQPNISGMATDPNHSGVVYAVGPGSPFNPGTGYVLKSADFGNTWTVLTQGQDFGGAVFVGPVDNQIIYGSNVGAFVGRCPATNGGKCGLFQSTDGGMTWTELSLPAALVQDVAFGNTGDLFAWSNAGFENAFVYKSIDGGKTWTTLLTDAGSGVFGYAVRVDPNAKSTVYAVGPTFAWDVSRSTDEGATWNAVQLPNGCNTPGQLICSIQIFIQDLLVVPQAGGTPSPPVITDVESGASFLPGVAANSWVTIKGTNLAPITDNWNNSIVNGQLPISLDKVSVSIGGRPAYVNYISSSQLNVLAPNVPAGPVAVTVTTPSGTSSQFLTTAGAYGPAFFLWPAGQVVATRQDFSFAVKPATFAATTVAAKPGDVLILWGTGFGPTIPPAPSGMAVPSTGGYTMSSAPTVSIDNTPATVYGGALAPGAVGLYQIAIQVPTTLADGDWPIQAAIGGATSPTGVILSVHQ